MTNKIFLSTLFYFFYYELSRKSMKQYTIWIHMYGI